MVATLAPIVPENLRHREAAQYCGVSLPTWERWVAGGRTPAPVKMGKRIVLFRRADLDRWIALRMPDRETFDKLAAAA